MARRRHNARLTSPPPQHFQVDGGAGVPVGNGGAPVDYATGVHPWVTRIWDEYDRVGEFHYGGNYLGSSLSSVVLRVGWLGEDGRPTSPWDRQKQPKPDVNGDLAEVARRAISTLRVPDGGQAEFLRRLGTNLATVADSWVFGWDVTEPGDRSRVITRRWEVYSIDEVKPMREKGGYFKRKVPGGQPEEIRPDAAIRIYRSHPRWSTWADPAARPLLDTLAHLRLLSSEGVANAMSRVASAGIYWVPDELSLEDDDDDPDAEEKLTEELMKTMGTAIADPASVYRYVPIIGRGPAQFLDAIRYDRFGSDDAGILGRKREASVSDFARGTDLPFETTVGYQGTTFANAFAVDDDKFRAHIRPWLLTITGHLTARYLWPTLALSDGKDPKGPLPEYIERMVVWWDASDLVSNPDRMGAATRGYGTATQPNFLLSSRASRGLMGVGEDDAPDEAEVAERIAIAQALKRAGRQPNEDDNEDDSPPERGPGEPEEPDAPPRDPDSTAGLASRIVDVAQFAAERAADRACSRLRNKARGNPAVVQANGLVRRVESADLHLVPQVLGPNLVGQILPSEEMFEGEFSSLARAVERWAIEAGYDNPMWVAQRVCAGVEALAGRLLFDRSLVLRRRDVEALLRGAAL